MWCVRVYGWKKEWTPSLLKAAIKLAITGIPATAGGTAAACFTAVAVIASADFALASGGA
jgi:hypothetical protein